MIAALLLAAGESKRMGRPKMLLPWGETTVLGAAIQTLQRAGIDEIVVITGGAREQVEDLLSGYAVRAIYNEEFARGEMLSSVQCGLARLAPGVGAALIALGDQPRVREDSVRLVMRAYRESNASIAVPSYRMRRGHPWLVARKHWDEILRMESPRSLREFLNGHARDICYVELDDPGILEDLDTPADYLKSRP
jgi:molybdenum cofactor cytidylyltransferase